MSQRYDRQIVIPNWNQKALTDASVIIVGMGALGNEVARVLGMSGIGQLIICDPDHVEESNLSRTLLFRDKDIGRLKVDAAADGLKQLAPELVVQRRARSLVKGVGLAELRDAALVLGCLDSRSARMQLAGRCQLTGAVYIDGGTHPWGGEVRPYLDPEGACYGCTLTTHERGTSDAPWSCLDTAQFPVEGAAVPSSVIVGAWMGMIAMRFLLGLPCPAGTLSIDASRGTTIVVKQERDPECPLHDRLGEVTRLEVGSQHMVGQLIASLHDGAVALLWEAALHRVECMHCGFSEPRYGIPSRSECPICERQLLPRLTLEIHHAPADTKLADLGVAPREILAARTEQGIRWFELKN
jgi:molybdopterin/thiamine biosynthesis adenylyltransferase